MDMFEELIQQNPFKLDKPVPKAPLKQIGRNVKVTIKGFGGGIPCLTCNLPILFKGEGAMAVCLGCGAEMPMSMIRTPDEFAVIKSIDMAMLHSSTLQSDKYAPLDLKHDYALMLLANPDYSNADKEEVITKLAKTITTHYSTNHWWNSAQMEFELTKIYQQQGVL